jgi:hypothetical protein
VKRFTKKETGASKGTVFEIINTAIFDVNIGDKGEQSGDQGADAGRSRGDQGAIKGDEKPPQNPHEQRAEPPSAPTGQDLKNLKPQKSESSKLIGSKREGSDFKGRKPRRLDDDELRDCPVFRDHAHFEDWLFSIEEKYTTPRMGVGTEATWRESFGGTLWVCYQKDRASFVAAWNEILYRLRPENESNPETRIRRIGAAFFDYFQTIQNPATKPKAVA